MLKTKIKAGSITNLTDARYFAAWEVEWMGFDLTPANDTHIDDKSLLAIKEWVEGVQFIGEFAAPSYPNIEAAIKKLDLHGLQVNEDYDASSLYGLPESIVKIQKIEPSRKASLVQLNDYLARLNDAFDYYLLDFESNGIDWHSMNHTERETLRVLCQKHPIIASIDLDASVVSELLESIRPAGLQVRGGQEEKVGYKSFDQLDEIFDSLEVLV